MFIVDLIITKVLSVIMISHVQNEIYDENLQEVIIEFHLYDGIISEHHKIFPVWYIHYSKNCDPKMLKILGIQQQSAWAFDNIFYTAYSEFTISYLKHSIRWK